MITTAPATDPATTVAVPRIDFFIIGTPKSGTTSLFHALQRHPAVFIPDAKEPEYYLGPPDTRMEAVDYAKLYACASAEAIHGDASVNYSVGGTRRSVNDVAAAIARDQPDARIIMMMRHPIERLYSAYCEKLFTRFRKGNTTADVKTFEDYIESDARALPSGRYINTLEAYWEHFPRSQTHCLFFEDLKQNAEAVLCDVVQFLGLDPCDITASDKPAQSNVSATKKQYMIDQAASDRSMLLALAAGLASRLPQSAKRPIRACWKRSPWYRTAVRSLEPGPLTKATRARLARYYRDATLELASVFDRDLSHWLV